MSAGDLNTGPQTCKVNTLPAPVTLWHRLLQPSSILPSCLQDNITKKVVCIFYSSSSPPFPIIPTTSHFVLNTTLVKVIGNLRVAKTSNQSLFLVFRIENVNLSLSFRTPKLPDFQKYTQSPPLSHRQIISYIQQGSGGGAGVSSFQLETESLHFSIRSLITSYGFMPSFFVLMTAEFSCSSWPHQCISDSHTQCFIYHLPNA